MPDSAFDNNVINLDEIPRVQQVPKKDLMPLYYQVNLAIRASLTFLLFIVLLVLKYEVFFVLKPNYHNAFHWAIVVVAAFGTFSMLYGYLYDRAIAYQVRELDITMYSGVFFKKVVTQPFLRLQHIELKRGPIERKFGLATIQVFSAGGSQHTFSLPGLTLKQATSLRQYILEHKDVAYHE
mgnify:FL=1